MDNESYLSDESIVKLYFLRDENAIAQTDLKYGKLLHTVAYNCLNDDECAKECQNDTYLETWNRIPPECPKLLRAFLCKITRCIAINRYKQMRAKRRVPSELTVSMEDLAYTLHSGDTAGAYDAKELGRVISDFVRSLPQKQRYIFMERYYMAGSVSDIAKALRLTESAVYKELTKIKLGLKMHLERNEIYI
jgi:RNA polymerase sigma-70 factor (ECF subfamily)